MPVLVPRNKLKKFKDIDLDFIRHPSSSDVSVKYDEDAIKRSVRNLVMLNKGEKPYHPEIGSTIRGLLFENFTPLLASSMEDAITETIVNWEPRVELTGVTVRALPERNELHATIHFYAIGIPQEISMDVFLERVR